MANFKASINHLRRFGLHARLYCFGDVIAWSPSKMPLARAWNTRMDAFILQLSDSNIFVFVWTGLCARVAPLQCSQGVFDVNYADVWQKTLDILVPINTTTCGDMVFRCDLLLVVRFFWVWWCLFDSGHTMLLVMLGMIWHTYFKTIPGWCTLLEGATATLYLHFQSFCRHLCGE